MFNYYDEMAILLFINNCLIILDTLKMPVRCILDKGQNKALEDTRAVDDLQDMGETESQGMFQIFTSICSAEII